MIGIKRRKHGLTCRSGERTSSSAFVCLIIEERRLSAKLDEEEVWRDLLFLRLDR